MTLRYKVKNHFNNLYVNTKADNNLELDFNELKIIDKYLGISFMKYTIILQNY